MNLSEFWEMVEDRVVWHAAVHGAVKSQTWLSDWTTTTKRKKTSSTQTGDNTDADILGRWISFKEFLPNDLYFLFEKGMTLLAEKGQGTHALEVSGRLGKVWNSSYTKWERMLKKATKKDHQHHQIPEGEGIKGKALKEIKPCQQTWKCSGSNL